MATKIFLIDIMCNLFPEVRSDFASTLRKTGSPGKVSLGARHFVEKDSLIEIDAIPAERRIDLSRGFANLVAGTGGEWFGVELAADKKHFFAFRPISDF